MPAGQAKLLCPALIILAPRHAYYAAVARHIRDIFHRYTPLVEPLSSDEAFLDVTHSKRLFGEPVDIGRRIKQEIKNELQLTASIGIASNKFLAKLGSDLAKPDGIVMIHPRNVQAFLDSLPVSKLWGAGKVTCARLHGQGVRTIGNLRGLRRPAFDDLFGDAGESLWNMAHGQDERRVLPDHKAKAISHETSFAEDIADPEILRDWLHELTRQVASRLRRNRFRGSTAHIKILFSDFRTITRVRTLPRHTDITKELWQAGVELMNKNLAMNRQSVRLLGFGVSGFKNEEPRQADLFAEPIRLPQSKLDTVSDWVQARFGVTALDHAVESRRPSC